MLDTHVWVSIFHRNRIEDLIDAVIEKGITLVSTSEQEKNCFTSLTIMKKSGNCSEAMLMIMLDSSLQ
ncbi:MAG: hypothetical protein K1X63_07560 [Chitinophagales bacterium]|nr:hypothetical protein [Chitinophagales bacterium]